MIKHLLYQTLEDLRRVVRNLRAHLTVARYRKGLARALHRDEGLREGYRANIAMLLHDQHGITGYKERNAAADDVLKLLFGV